MTPDTIYALSSGRPPAAIAVIRISGPGAGTGLKQLANVRLAPRRATVAALRDPVTNDLLDRALLLWMPGPDSATGEDVAELHLHGSHAVVAAVSRVLAALPGFREARSGEFTRRAFEHGRIDINEAEGLADLLAAETDGQRRAALLAAGGVLSRRIEEWREQLLGISAVLEAALDFADEGDVDDASSNGATLAAARLADEISMMTARSPAERLKNGIRVVVAGPPNAGKSSLVNAIAQRNAAIESSIAGTTRDVIEVPLVLGGLPIILVDTAGLRTGKDEIEAAGVARARQELAGADIVMWLGGEDLPDHAEVIAISPQADRGIRFHDRLAVSAKTGFNLDRLIERIVAIAKTLLPPDGEMILNLRQRRLASDLAKSLSAIVDHQDPVIRAEEARHALAICDGLAGRTGVEDMLDALFGRFCIGK